MDENSCDISPRALVQDVENDTIAFVHIARSSRGAETFHC